MFKNIVFKTYTFFLSLVGKKTVGARALVIRDHQEILLVKHTYISGWYTIGGGVDKNESALTAVKRELYEEAGIIPTKDPTLFGFYHNRKEKRDDYVALYLCTEFTQQTVSSGEVFEVEWFSLEALPEDVTPATRRRIEEYLGKRAPGDVW